MNDIEERIKITNLLYLYGELLSSTQKDVLDLYFIYDLSLAEIAENKNISRSAVEDAIKKGKEKLKYFESKLKLLEKNSKIGDLLEKMSSCKDFEQNKKYIEVIKTVIKNGI